MVFRPETRRKKQAGGGRTGECNTRPKTRLLYYNLSALKNQVGIQSGERYSDKDINFLKKLLTLTQRDSL